MRRFQLLLAAIRVRVPYFIAACRCCCTLFLVLYTRTWFGFGTKKKTRPEDAGKRERRKKHQQDIGQNETSRWNPFGRFIPCMLVGCLFRCAQDVKHLLLECLIMCFRFFSLFSFFAATFFDVFFYSLLIRLMVKRNEFRMRCQRIIRFQDIVCKQPSWRVRGEGIARWPNIQMDPSQMLSCNVFLHFGSILLLRGTSIVEKWKKCLKKYFKSFENLLKTWKFVKRCSKLEKLVALACNIFSARKFSTLRYLHSDEAKKLWNSPEHEVMKHIWGFLPWNEDQNE